MKKRLVMIITCICMVLLLTGCSKDKIKADAFINISMDNNLSVTSESSREQIETVVNELIASNDKYVVEFYEFKDIESAKDFFDDRKNTFKNSKVYKSHVSLTGNNYSSFAIEANGRYSYICRVDDTILLVLSDEEHKDEVKELIKKYGY